MKDFINNIYSNDYFVTGLFIAIAVLTVIFIVVLYFAIKDNKKSKIENFKNENNLDGDIESEGKKVNSILNTAEFAFTTNPPEEVEIPALTPLEEAETQELSFDYDPFKPGTIEEEDSPVKESEAFDLEVPSEPAVEEVPIEEKVVDLDVFELISEEPEKVDEDIEIEPEVNDIEETPESYEDAFKEFSFDEKSVNELPSFEFEVEESVEEPVKEQEEIPRKELEYTQRIILPEQFSSVYVDKKEPVVEEPVELQTVEFEIKETTLDMDEVKNIKRPHQLKRSSILSQLPKLATEGVARKEEVKEQQIDEQPVIQEQPISALDRFETETYDISNK